MPEKKICLNIYAIIKAKQNKTFGIKTVPVKKDI